MSTRNKFQEMIELLRGNTHSCAFSGTNFGASTMEQEMISSYVKAIAGQVGNPSLQILESQFVYHDGQDLSASAPVSRVLITFG